MNADYLQPSMQLRHRRVRRILQSKWPGYSTATNLQLIRYFPPPYKINPFTEKAFIELLDNSFLTCFTWVTLNVCVLSNHVDNN